MSLWVQCNCISPYSQYVCIVLQLLTTPSEVNIQDTSVSVQDTFVRICGSSLKTTSLWSTSVFGQIVCVHMNVRGGFPAAGCTAVTRSMIIYWNHWCFKCCVTKLFNTFYSTTRDKSNFSASNYLNSNLVWQDPSQIRVKSMSCCVKCSPQGLSHFPQILHMVSNVSLSVMWDQK